MKLTELYPESTDVLVLERSDFSVSVAPTAKALKFDAIIVSSRIQQVGNAQEQEIAVAAQTGLDNLIRLTEKARKQIKQPVIDLGRKIDAQAESFVNELALERTRVTRLIADFQQLELAKVRAAEAALKVENDRIERERQLELSQAKTLEDMDAVQERFNAQSAALAAQPVPTVAKAQGQIVKNDWTIVVHDPYRLAKYHPACVSITPKLGEIKQLLAQGITVNGVTATPIVKVQTRTTAGPKMIDV